tara:strand:+ start:253 stop:735 length:483 start_codon:yes stop_codon:yes gene_type:complete
MAALFNDMSPLSRVWVFQSDRLLSAEEQVFIKTRLSSFVALWATHGKPLHGAFTIKNNCSVIVTVDENNQEASGCSISSLTALFESFGTEFKLSFFDRFSIAYKSKSIVVLSSVKEFKELIKVGKVSKETLVYNNLISLKQDLESNWEIPLKLSWQKRYL